MSNLAVLNVAETISSAGGDDYGKTDTITSSSSNITSSVVTGTSYTDSTKTINKTAHGLTAASIGSRISILVNNTGTSLLTAAITEITGITDADNFTIAQAIGSDVPAGSTTLSITYAVFSPFSGPTVNLSDYPMINITKITDSVNKEIRYVSPTRFDNLSRYDEYEYGIWYTKHGQILYFYIGTQITSIGVWTLFYATYPQRVMIDDDLLDIRDPYIPLVTDLAKSYALEHLNKAVPDTLQTSISNKTNSVKDNIITRQQMLMQKENK